MKLVGESMAIWKGAVRGAIWPEGPHLYKKDGYYYLLHAEGGTGPEHSISVARSRKLFQWFEGCPRNPIFTHQESWGGLSCGLCWAWGSGGGSKRELVCGDARHETL